MSSPAGLPSSGAPVRREPAAEAVAQLRLGPGDAVLDAGCGSGSHLSLLAAAVDPRGSVTGVDADAAALGRARELYDDLLASGRVTLVEADVRELPFPDDSFDLAWSCAALHHVERADSAVRELARVVKPGGTVAVLEGDVGGTFPFLPLPLALDAELRAGALRAEADGYGEGLPYVFDGAIGRRLPRLLDDAGLEEIRVAFVTAVASPVTVEEARAFHAWVREVLSERLGAAVRAEALEELASLVDPDRPGCVLLEPGGFLVRPSFLVSGAVSAR